MNGFRELIKCFTFGIRILNIQTQMKNILMILLAAVSLSANAQLQTPAASSAGSVSSRVGLTDVKIDYSRPKMKGRKIFGEGSDVLVPNGKIWRTGANDGTKITFSEDVKVEGMAVPKGTYLIFTWPGASEWSISLYKDLTLGGNTDKYDAANEQARFKAPAQKLAEKTETLTFSIGDISEDNASAKVQLTWENTSVKFGVTVDNDTKISEGIDATSITAARYFFDTKKDAKQALPWIQAYFAGGKHGEEFWNLHLMAQIQKAAGDNSGALASAQKSLDVAKNSKEGDFGYNKRNDDLIKSLPAVTAEKKKKK
jgi:hypothetical protein